MLADWEQVLAASEPDTRNVRLAESTHPLDFRVGKDFKARYVFQLDAPGAPELRSAVPRISGIECEIEECARGVMRLTLTLINQADLSNFRLMCTGLMLATEAIGPGQGASGLLKVLEELHRWQEMLRHRRDRLLTRSEIIGLVGELLFLRDILCSRLSILGALRCWNGPEGHEQDFVVGGTIFEVKTQVVTADRRIRISSEDQLDAVQGRILLANQGLAPLPASDLSGRSLNGLVRELREIAGSSAAAAADLLDIALLAARYDERDEYDEEFWVLVDRAFYEVRDDFPRIERSDLRPGVEMVTYAIRVSDCQSFAVDVEETMAEMIQ